MHPAAPETLVGREAAMAALEALEPGRRAVLVAPSGAGRSAVVATFATQWAQKNEGDVLWGRPDAMPLVAMLGQWSQQLGLPAPGAVDSPRQYQDWALRALKGRECLVVVDAVPPSELARAHALIVDGPTYVFVCVSDEGWRAEPIPLEPLSASAIQTWLNQAAPHIEGDRLGEAASALGACAPAVALMAHTLRGMDPAEASAWLAALTPQLTAADAPLTALIIDRSKTWPEGALWPALGPAGGMTGGALSAGPVGAADLWRAAGLLGPMGDGLSALPLSLHSALTEIEAGDALRQRYVDWALGAEDASVETLAAAVPHAGALKASGALATLIGKLTPPMMGRGQGFDLLPLLGVWSKAAQATADLSAQATVKRYQGEIFAALGHAPRGLGFLRQAVALADEAKAPQLSAMAMLSLARVKDSLGDTEGAIDDFAAANKRFEAAGDEAGRVAALDSLAMALVKAGHLKTAVRAFRKMAERAQVLGDRHAMAAAQRHEGLAWLRLKEHGEAIAPLSAARDSARALGDHDSEVIALKGLGLSLAALERHEEAKACWHDLIPLARATRDLAGEILCARELASLADKQGAREEQLRHLEQARLLARTQREAHLEAEIIGDIAAVYAAQGDLAAAIETYRGQAQAAATGGMTEVAARALAKAAPLMKQSGKEDEARAMLQEMRLRLVRDGGPALGVIDAALYQLVEG